VCVSFCIKTSALFWNHEDCPAESCSFASGPYGHCEDCRHSQDGRCALTNAPLPATEERGGCCHWNATPVQGWQIVTREMLAPLGIGPDELDVALLKSLEVPYRLLDGQPAVDPASLGLPQIFGRGTEHQAEETLDWSEWERQWCTGL
jgi:hypothetical protein